MPAFAGSNPVDPGVGAAEEAIEELRSIPPREPGVGGDVAPVSTEVGARATGVSVGSPVSLDAAVGAGVAPEVGVEEEDTEQPHFVLNWSVDDAT